MTDHLRTLAEISRFPISCFPNAGLPDEDGHYNELPPMLAKKIERFCAEGWINIIGGCCGTTAEHIRMIADDRRALPAAAAGAARGAASSRGIETLVIDEDTRPVIVGERTNVLGSRKFKQLIADGKFEEASEIGRAAGAARRARARRLPAGPRPQRARGHHHASSSMLVKKVKVPLMIDSTDAAALEEALKRTQGKSIINSINLEDGEERFERVVPLARRYGAALVVGCIDEDKQQAQAVTRERKLAIAAALARAADREVRRAGGGHLLRRAGLPGRHRRPELHRLRRRDDRGHPPHQAGAARHQDDPRRLQRLLRPAAGRARGAELGLPLPLRAGRPRPGDRQLGEARALRLDPGGGAAPGGGPDLVARRRPDRRLRGALPRQVAEGDASRTRSDLPLDERLARYILEGTKDGLYADLDEALQTRAPLEIINGPLMAGMDEVGRLFGNNEMIVAEVLQSAEAMKAAVGHLEPHMEKADSATKGRIVLATVKGDVHDIGKNLVDIILSNNGFKVVNLGIKVPPEELVRAYQEHQPDAIGLSGLLVKSAQMMVVTAQDLQRRGRDVPDPGRRRGAVEPLHAAEDRARVRRRGRLRQRRHDRARPGQPAHGPGAPRRSGGAPGARDRCSCRATPSAGPRRAPAAPGAQGGGAARPRHPDAARPEAARAAATTISTRSSRTSTR